MKEKAKSNKELQKTKASPKSGVKEKNRSSVAKVKQAGTTDKHNSKKIHDKAEHSGGKEISLVTLK